jgi:single-strand DNA-binding protein
LATNNSYKDKNGVKQETTDWHNIVASRGVDFIEQYITKGAKVYIEGKIKANKWEDKEGITRYSTSIYTDEVKKLDKKDDDIPAGDNYIGGNYKEATEGF